MSQRAQSTTQPQGRTVTSCDPVWQTLLNEANEAMRADPALGGALFGAVTSHASLEAAVVHRIAESLGPSGEVDTHLVVRTFLSLLERRPELGHAFRADLSAVLDRDPAASRYLDPLMYFKGFHALAVHRFAHELWQAGRRDFAFYLQSRSSRVFTVDIHPAARLGIGLMLDHAHGIVIGETAVVGDHVSIMQEVTLGGTGNDRGDRHPKIGDNVMIGAGAKVLGNIRVGACSRIAAGSIVLKEVPANTTVAGVPAKVVGPAGCPEPARTMDQRLSPDDCGCGSEKV